MSMAHNHCPKPRLLLHVCCGPCATAVLERLLPRFEVELLWYNPNIQPPAEHQRRYQAVRQVAKHFGVRLRAIEPDEARWLGAVAGLEDEPEGGRRCTVCFDYRLRRAAKVAGRENFDYLTTTLAILGLYRQNYCGCLFALKAQQEKQSSSQ